MDDKLFESIINRINDGNCVAIIGPRLIDVEGMTMDTHLRKLLDKSLGKKVTRYSEEKLLSFDEKTRGKYVKDEVKKYFDELEPNDLYRHLAEIPFSMIINTSPDHLLKTVLDENKEINAVYDYYSKAKPEPPKCKTRMRYIYNLFGDYTDLDSMILTNKDLYEYLQGIMEDIDHEVKTILDEAEAVLFLGFGLDKWYFRFLLRLMNVEDKYLYSDSIEDEIIKDYYEEEFDMEFFEVNAEAIIEKLYHEKQQGKLKEPEEKEFHAEIYISYAWKNEGEEMAVELKKAFQDNKIRLIRDKDDLHYKESIRKFMDDIGKGHVVLIISKKYLESDYCMYELIEIRKNSDSLEEFKKRIFPIVLEDAVIFNPQKRLKYLEYWQGKMNEVDQGAQKSGLKTPHGLNERYAEYKDYLENFEELVGFISDMNYYNTDMHRETNYHDLIKNVKKELRISEED